MEKCIKSIIQQSFTDFECLLIDDGSTDSITKNICKKYSQSDRRVKYFEKENQGIEKTRIYGIERAEGDYIMFSDHDDYYEPDAFKKLYAKAVRSDSDIVVANGYEKYITWLPFRRKALGIYLDKDIEKDEFIANYYCNFFGINIFPVTTWAKLYKKKLLTQVQFECLGFNFCEDVILNIQIFPEAAKVSFLSDILYTHIYGGTSSGIDAKNVLDGYCASCNYKLKYLKKYGLVSTYGKYVFYEIKNVIQRTIDIMIESKQYSKDEFINILKSFRETDQFAALSSFYAGNHPLILQMDKCDYTNIYQDAVCRYKKRKLKVYIRNIIKKKVKMLRYI